MYNDPFIVCPCKLLGYLQIGNDLNYSYVICACCTQSQFELFFNVFETTIQKKSFIKIKDDSSKSSLTFRGVVKRIKILI